MFTKSRNKKGFTLVELMVSSGIFVIVISLAVSGFLLISKMKILSTNMVESQQKVRIALEMISRLSFQAQKMQLSAFDASADQTLELYFNTKNDNVTGARFVITTNGKLTFEECTTSNINTDNLSCNNWGQANNLLGNKVVLSRTSPRISKFTKPATIPATIQVELYGNIAEVIGNPYYNDVFDISTNILMSNIQ